MTATALTAARPAHPAPPAGQTLSRPVDTKRPRPVVENDAYAAFARRILRAYARRIAAATSKP